MKRILSQLIICLSILSCPQFCFADTSSQIEDKLSSQLILDAEEILKLIHESETLRQQIPEFIDAFEAATSANRGAIPAEFSLRIVKAMAQAENIRNSLFNQALKHRPALYRANNPNNSNDHEQLAEIIMAMASAITLYENHDALSQALHHRPLLYKKLNEAYPEVGLNAGFYESSLIRSKHPEYRKAMSDAIAFFKQNQISIQQIMNTSPQAISSLHEYIANSDALHSFKDNSFVKTIIQVPKNAGSEIIKLPHKGLKKLTFESSKIIGNSIGLFRFRAGKFNNQDEVERLMQENLQPGDILLEKTPFTLSDKTIPGHFGHAAIYVGTTQQLMDIGADHLPEIQAHWDDLNQDKVIVEALRDGVQLSKLRSFLNVDDVAILRAKNLTHEQQLNAIRIAFSQLGKRYDFNFDVNTTETIVCSELVYLSYPSIDFITKRVLNSFTISPDDIALQAGYSDHYPLELILFGHDGNIVFDIKKQEEGQLLYSELIHQNVKSPKNQQAQHSDFFKGFLTAQDEKSQ